MAELFVGSDHAVCYRKYRPTYSSDVYKTIISYCNRGNSAFRTALDIGCGSGQSTFPLASYFENVIGLDPSESQINEARECVNESIEEVTKKVSFQVGSAEDLSRFESNSIDLITFAESFHWIDTESFYPQAKRVLRPSGVLVAYGYGIECTDTEATSSVIYEFDHHILGLYWDSRKRHIDNGLRDFTFPFNDFLRDDSLTMKKTMTITDYVGFARTFSGCQTYMRHHPGDDLLGRLQRRLCDACDTRRPDKTELQITWPIHILMGRNTE